MAPKSVITKNSDKKDSQQNFVVLLNRQDAFRHLRALCQNDGLFTISDYQDKWQDEDYERIVISSAKKIHKNQGDVLGAVVGTIRLLPSGKNTVVMFVFKDAFYHQQLSRSDKELFQKFINRAQSHFTTSKLLQEDSKKSIWKVLTGPQAQIIAALITLFGVIIVTSSKWSGEFANTPSQTPSLILQSTPTFPSPTSDNSTSLPSSTPYKIIVVDGMSKILQGTFIQGSTRGQLNNFEKLCLESLAGCNADTFIDEQPQRVVTLSTFWIDVFEVTNEQFQEFVVDTQYKTTAELSGNSFVWNDQKHLLEEVKGAEWENPTGPNSSIKTIMKYPVVQVSWIDAETYCRWKGKRLPTEAEWEKVARGSNGWTYPWGNEWCPDCLNFSLEFAPGPSEIGQYPTGIGPYGNYDLLGNVFEWVSDWYDSNYYQSASNNNPMGPSDNNLNEKVKKGGSWATRAGFLHAAWRSSANFEDTSNLVGFRCAKD